MVTCLSRGIEETVEEGSPSTKTAPVSVDWPHQKPRTQRGLTFSVAVIGLRRGIEQLLLFLLSNVERFQRKKARNSITEVR